MCAMCKKRSQITHDKISWTLPKEWMFSKEISVVLKMKCKHNKWKISIHFKKSKESFETLHFSAKFHLILYFWTWNAINGFTSVHVNTKCREKFCQLTFGRVVELEAKTQWVQSLFYNSVWSFILLKFIYSENVTKFCEITTLILIYVAPVK